jgi:hypothetical protein
MVIQGIAGQSGQNYYLVAYQPCIYGGMMHVFTIMGHWGNRLPGIAVSVGITIVPCCPMPAKRVILCAAHEKEIAILHVDKPGILPARITFSGCSGGYTST